MAGARSVSDLTRDAMRMLLNGADRQDGFGAHMDEFRAEIRKLDKKIEALAATVVTLKIESGR